MHNFKIPGYDTIRNYHSTGQGGSVDFLVKYGLVKNKEYRNNDFNIITDNEALAIDFELSDHNQNAELFSEDNTGLTEVSPKFTEPDSDLSNVVRKAVNLLKNKADHTLTTTSSCNIKYPCGICKKSVNKNQKAINCSVCSEWVHIKFNGVSVNEYEKLVEEEESIPLQCILCDIEDMASKFPFCCLSKLELISSIWPRSSFSITTTTNI